MPRPICFADVETTHLQPDLRRFWEAALIDADGNEYSWFIDWADLDLGNADPVALSIGRFYERHPQANAQSPVHDITIGPRLTRSEREVLRTVERLTRGAVLVGSNASFEQWTLDPRMRAHGILPSWHYKAKCIADLAEGFLRGRGVELTGEEKSDDLSRLVGVDPAKFERHTALGDCHWARAVYDAIRSTSSLSTGASA